MTSYDFSPLFRSTIGFDRLSRLMDSALRSEEASYPPYNIEKLDENAYRITMAVAGFGPEDITITTQENALLVTGKMKNGEDQKAYLYRGIAGRAFERRFQLGRDAERSRRPSLGPGATLSSGPRHPTACTGSCSPSLARSLRVPGRTY